MAQALRARRRSGIKVRLRCVRWHHSLSTVDKCKGSSVSESDSPFDTYLSGIPEPRRAALERIRRLVRGLVPSVEESTSYGMPTFKYRGRPLLGFRAASKHLSVFPYSPAAIDAARPALAGFDVSKGTVRFTLDKPLPDAALEQLVRERLREIDSD